MRCGRGTQKCLLLNGDRAFPMAQLACNVGDTGDARSISESGRSPGEGKWPSTPVRAWRMPWTGEPGGLQSTGSQSVRHNWKTGQHAMGMGRRSHFYTLLSGWTLSVLGMVGNTIEIATWIRLEIIMLSEVRERKFHMTPLPCGI